MADQDHGASADADQALVSDQAATRLDPSGFDPSREAVVAMAARWDDGVSARLLLMRCVAEGWPSSLVQRRIQQCLDRGELRLGSGLRLRPRDSGIAPPPDPTKEPSA